VVNYNPKRRKGASCEPGCTCRRHTNNTHRPGCLCPRCRPKRSAEEIAFSRKHKRPDRCVCGHIEKRHDLFGCKACEEKGGPDPGGQLCGEFRALDAPAKPQDVDYARQVAKYSFIAHQRELATCTKCWQVIKIGYVHSLECVLNARAHYLKYHDGSVKRRGPYRTG
jgi:hypothetical protein